MVYIVDYYDGSTPVVIWDQRHKQRWSVFIGPSFTKSMLMVRLAGISWVESKLRVGTIEVNTEASVDHRLGYNYFKLLSWPLVDVNLDASVIYLANEHQLKDKQDVMNANLHFPGSLDVV